MNNLVKISKIVSLFIFLSATGVRPALCAQGRPLTISIADFTVQSDNPQYKYLGKGFAEFIAIDLLKSKRVALVEREKRIELLKEQAFALSGAVDPQTAITAGKLLSADYLVMGSIFDLLDQVTVAFRITDTTTGEVVFEDKISDKLSKYDRISSRAAEKMLTYLKVQLPKDLVAKANMPQPERSQDVAINFSKAVDSYDKKDYENAGKELKAAKELDPENTAVNIYINKLFMSTTKFKVMPEKTVSYYNPAYLGFLQKDQFYFSNVTQAGAVMDTAEGAVWKRKPSQVFSGAKGDGLGAEERIQGISILGYNFPLGKNYGMGLEIYRSGDPFSKEQDNMNVLGTSDVSYAGWSTLGGGMQSIELAMLRTSIMRTTLSIGRRLGESSGLGFGLSYYNKRRLFTPIHQALTDSPEPFGVSPVNYEEDFSYLGAQLGFMTRNKNEDTYFDAVLGYTPEKETFVTLPENQLLDQSDLTAANFSEYNVPLFNENTLTKSYNNKRTYVVIKQYNNIYTDRSYFVGGLMPAVEHWLFKSVSVRGGLDYTATFGDTSTSAVGFIAGATYKFKLLGRDVDFDFNYTKRNRASRMLEGLLIPEDITFLTLSVSGLLSK
jgi:TolB-like protein